MNPAARLGTGSTDAPRCPTGAPRAALGASSRTPPGSYSQREARAHKRQLKNRSGRTVARPLGESDCDFGPASHNAGERQGWLYGVLKLV